MIRMTTDRDLNGFGVEHRGIYLAVVNWADHDMAEVYCPILMKTVILPTFEPWMTKGMFVRVMLSATDTVRITHVEKIHKIFRIFRNYDRLNRLSMNVSGIITRINREHKSGYAWCDQIGKIHITRNLESRYQLWDTVDMIVILVNPGTVTPWICNDIKYSSNREITLELNAQLLKTSDDWTVVSEDKGGKYHYLSNSSGANLQFSLDEMKIGDKIPMIGTQCRVTVFPRLVYNSIVNVPMLVTPLYQRDTDDYHPKRDTTGVVQIPKKHVPKRKYTYLRFVYSVRQPFVAAPPPLVNAWNMKNIGEVGGRKLMDQDFPPLVSTIVKKQSIAAIPLIDTPPPSPFLNLYPPNLSPVRHNIMTPPESPDQNNVKCITYITQMITCPDVKTELMGVVPELSDIMMDDEMFINLITDNIPTDNTQN